MSPSEEPRARLLLRLFKNDYVWDIAERFYDALPGVRRDPGKDSIVAQLRRSRLFIGTYNSTTYLEAFVADIPSVLFWNPAHWEIRSAAREAVEDLRRAGILHGTPEAAAVKVNEIWRDPLAWWKRPEVRAAKSASARYSPRPARDFIESWARSSGAFWLNGGA